WRTDAAIAPPSDGRAPDRTGWLEAPRNDAVDRQEQAGRPIEELSIRPAIGQAIRRSSPVARIRAAAGQIKKPSKGAEPWAAFAILRFYKKQKPSMNY